MKVSVLLLTIDRYELTEKYVGEALRNAGHEFDLCVTDNGSTDQRVIDLIESWEPKYFQRNSENLGTTQMFNQMIRENPADGYVLIGNDIQMPPNWLRAFVDHAQMIPQTGTIGIDWMMRAYPRAVFNGREVDFADKIYGPVYIPRSTRDKVGDFCEDYGKYGYDDTDWSLRCRSAGLVNYYISFMKCIHHGGDVGEDSDYRRMKDAHLKANKSKLLANLEKYNVGNYYIKYPTVSA